MTAAIFRAADGPALPAAVDRWFGPVTLDDHTVLDRAVPPVLDVGCGPGRHVLALAERGHLALGIDITRAALDRARRCGAPVLARSVFERVPGAGRWATVLLLDGNLGIGGDPIALLTRVASLLRPDGLVLVEVQATAASGDAAVVRLDIDGVDSPWFRWMAVGAADLPSVADAAGLRIDDVWGTDGRCFGQLRRG
jgi:SAM-dependent methyltransferase